MKEKILLVFLFFTISILNAKTLDKVDLQLQWKHQFQFAGYYMAKEKGYFKDVGLDVNIKEYEFGINTTDEVINNKNTYAIGRASLVVDKSNGKDIILLSSIFQSSPLILLATKTNEIKTISDFKDKRIMFVDDKLSNTALKAMILSQGVSYDNLTMQKHSFNLNDLMENKTDLITAYISNEPFFLEKKGIPYTYFAPKDYGYDFYSDILFTSRSELINNPDRVKKIKEATLKGWKYAFYNIDETVELILRKYNTQNKSKEALLFEAGQLKKLAKLKEFELGEIKKERIEKIYEVYHLLGLAKNSVEFDDFIYDDKLDEKFLLSSKELSYLESKKQLNMCIDPNWLPFEKIENGKHIGMSSEYIKLFQEKLPIPITLVQTKGWLETVAFAKQRKCDFITLMSINEERKDILNFSDALMKMPIVIATTVNRPFINDISNLMDKKFAIVKGFAYRETLLKKYPNIKLIDVKGPADGLQKVETGEAYGFIGVLPVIGYNIQEKFVGELKIAGKLDGSWNFSMASRNDEPILNDIINKFISKISTKQNSEILNRWISIKYEESIDYTKLILLSGFFLLIIIVVLIKNNSIRKINNKLNDYVKLVDENVLTSSTDLQGNITYVSKAFCLISGYTNEELIGQNHRIIRHEDMPDELFKDLWQTLESGSTWKGEIKNKRKDGSAYWVKATISPTYDEKHNKIGYTAIRHDITDKKLVEEISITDALTNIYNRRYFNDISNKYINSAKRHNDFLCFLIMDVDHFKEYNDTYGHQEGDEVLKQIAKVLNDRAHRADDYCFRLGGEEFGLLYKANQKEKALFFANMIKTAIEGLQIKHEKNSASRYVTVSMGLYCDYSKEASDFEYVYKKADELLYKSKNEGRNKISIL